MLKNKKTCLKAYDKEHVTSFARYNRSFKKLNLTNKINLFDFARLTLDEQEDFKIISKIINNFYPRYNYKLSEIIKFLKKKILT